MVNRQQTVDLFFHQVLAGVSLEPGARYGDSTGGEDGQGGGFLFLRNFEGVTPPPARGPYIPHRYSILIGWSSPPAVDTFRKPGVFPVFRNFSPDFVPCECRKNHILRDSSGAGGQSRSYPPLKDMCASLRDRRMLRSVRV